MSKKSPAETALIRNRFTNAKGAIIPMHHAFKIIQFSPLTRLTMVLLPVIFVLIVWSLFSQIAWVWESIFAFWMQMLAPGAGVSHNVIEIVGQSVNMPFPALAAALPTADHVWLNLIVTIVLFVLSFLLPIAWMPFVYLLRMGLMLQCSASIYFLLVPDHFPYELGNYITDMLTLGLYMIFLIPFVLAVIFYIFEFPIWWKCLITTLCLCFFVVFLPFQYMLHAYIIGSTSLLFLPLLYFLFGVLIDVLMFITFYSLGMSWRQQSRKKNDLGRFA